MAASFWGAAARFQEFAKQYTKYTHEAHLVESAASAHHHRHRHRHCHCHCHRQTCKPPPAIRLGARGLGEHSNVPLLIDFYFIFIRSTRSQLAVLLLSLFVLPCRQRKRCFFFPNSME